MPRYTSRPVAIAASVSISLLVLGGCSQPQTQPEPQPDLQSFYEQEVAFEPCEGYGTTSADEDAFASDPAFQCARVEVPLNYDDPSGRTAHIALLKVPATGDRIGSLLMNPGGPGGPGMSMAAAGATTLADSSLTERFDLVGFDPRGVGASTPAIDCFTDEQNEAGDTYTTVVAGSRTLSEDGSRRLVEQCADRSGGRDVLAHVGTLMLHETWTCFAQCSAMTS